MIDLCEDLLVELVNLDTRSNQNRETDAAMVLKKKFDSYDIPSDLIEYKKGKGNLVSFIAGSDASKSNLLLLAHLDTAEYGDLKKWKFTPNKATHYKNCIFGRGTLDCKGLISIFASVMIYLKANNIKLKRGVIFAATSDEENGGIFGCSKLHETNSLINNCEYVLGEGGGFPIKVGKETFYTCQVGEKGLLKYKCSMSEAAILPDYPINIDNSFNNNIYNLFSNGLGSLSFFEFMIKQRLESSFKRRLDINSMINNTISKIQKESEVTLELSYLPGYSRGKLEKAVYKKFGIKISDDNLIQQEPATRSSSNSNLFKAIRSVVKSTNPNDKVIPIITPGYSDNRFLRGKGKSVYGFFPLSNNNLISGIHGYNEYITRQSLELAFQMALKVILKFCTM